MPGKAAPKVAFKPAVKPGPKIVPPPPAKAASKPSPKRVT
eukprot:gene17580-17471_t